MRKKELLEQNMSLFQQLKKTEVEVTRLTSELKKANEQIRALTKQQNEGAVPLAQELLEETKIEITDESAQISEEAAEIEVILNDIEAYGADVIGKIVVNAANCSNKLTFGGATSNRELVNLILGRTEVAKSEILSITLSEGSFEEKSALIDGVYESATEYINSVMAQIP